MDKTQNSCKRVIGFDSHPDSFTAAIILGETPAGAVVDKVYNKIPNAHLQRWVKKNTTPNDLFVMEASGNSFQMVRDLEKLGREAKVLESCYLGKLKEAHCNNDKLSAIRIGKAYLAGTAKIVWVPDPKTQERRDWFLAYQKAVKHSVQHKNSLLSYLSDNGVRLDNTDAVLAPKADEILRQIRQWTPRQWQVIELKLAELRHATEQRQRWDSLLAQEVLNDSLLLSLVRLCGIRHKVAFALGAIIGDITRFPNPKKLVKYAGLNPAMDESGEGQWSGGIGGHGRKDLRSLLLESAHSIFNSSHPLAKWGRKLDARKGGAHNLAAAAVARKLLVAVWYLMMGRWTPLLENDIDARLSQKIGKIITSAGISNLKATGTTRKEMREQAIQRLAHGRAYLLDWSKKYIPKPKKGLAAEYGIA